jgi:hypothetical protein
MRIVGNILRRVAKLVGPVAPVTAAGNSQSTATALTGVVNIVSAADDTKGVVLPAGATAGEVVTVVNTVSNKVLKVYPSTGGDINNGSDNAAITMRAAQTALFVALGSDNWGAVYDTDTTS